ncbi:MAG: hypothetical protein ACRDQA_03440 [Nocardioidaceae bacterium]
MDTRPLTVRLDVADYERLEASAGRFGMRPGTLARMMLHAGLSGAADGSVDAVRAVLDRLDALTARMPPVDAVAVAAAVRGELDERQSA